MTTDLDARISEAHAILDEAYWRHVERPGKRLTAIVVLFSGGNDSTILAHLFRERATHFGHANTGIGIEQTREFVRRVSDDWGVELLETHAEGPDLYRTQVLRHGFPGPGRHDRMFQRLKEHQFDKIRRQVITHTRRERFIFIAGRRKEESARRTSRWKSGQIVAHERDGSTVWCSPLMHWTAADMEAYRERFPDVPRNEVSDMLHMSGECLCGAFAHPGELDEIGFFFPEVKAEINALEVEVRAAGHVEPKCIWGWGADFKLPKGLKVHPLCEGCIQGRLFEDEVAS